MRLAPEPHWKDVPASVGGLTLEPVELARVTEVLTIGSADISSAFRAEVGVDLPQQGRTEVAGDVRVLWSGREAVLVLGARVNVEGALCTDQSDGWAALLLRGTVREVLARLCPLDLREREFPIGAAARSLLNHVPVLLARIDEGRWLLLAPSSMAETALEEIEAAGRGLAAR